MSAKADTPRKVQYCDTYRAPHLCPTDHITVARPELFCRICERCLLEVDIAAGKTECGQATCAELAEKRGLKGKFNDQLKPGS